MNNDRESRLASTFVRLTDTLVVGFDMVDLLHSLVETTGDLLEASAVGLVLSDGSGELDVAASTNENTALIELAQVRAGTGPCVECYVTGRPVFASEIGSRPDWEEFDRLAATQGFQSVHSVPLRLRETIIGALTMYWGQPNTLSATDATIAQSLADVATISILQERALRESDLTVEQLQIALESRVLIEQAKGVLAWTHNLGMDEAFALLRGYARSNSMPLKAVAAGVVDRSLSI